MKIYKNIKNPSLSATWSLSFDLRNFFRQQEQRLMMEQNVTRLINDCGACENVFSTPIPVAFTRQTTRFLFLWLLFLPFALTSQLGVGVVLVQQLLSFGLLGIEDITIQIEQHLEF